MCPSSKDIQPTTWQMSSSTPPETVCIHVGGTAVFSQCGPRAVLTLLSSVTMQLKGPSHLDTLHAVTRAHCISDIMRM